MANRGGVGRRAVRWVLQSLLAALAVALLLAGWFWIEANARIESKRAALTKELPALLAADELQVGSILRGHPLFATPSGEDAGPFLNERLGWNSDRGTLLTDECRKILRDAGLEWRSLTKAQVGACDTRWLHDLRRFDRWSLTAGYRTHHAEGARTDFAIPELIDLQNVAKLHLRAAEDSEQAAQDVRHLARLLFTQSYLMSTMIGLSLLSIEDRSWELSGQAWSPPPIRTADREVIRLHLFTAEFGVNPIGPASLAIETIEGMPGFRRCLLLTEQCFGQLRTTLPEAEGCDFEHARWELAHPYQQSPGDPTQGLSWPASRGAAIVKVLSPERYASLALLLIEADGLPATGRWAGRQSEYLERLLGPH